jgi:hypothetical protein
MVCIELVLKGTVVTTPSVVRHLYHEQKMYNAGTMGLVVTWYVFK